MFQWNDPLFVREPFPVRLRKVGFLIAALFDHPCKCNQDIRWRLTANRGHLYKCAGHFDAGGIAPQVVLMFGEPIREITHCVGNRVSEPGNSLDPIGAAIWFPSGYTTTRLIILFCAAPPRFPSVGAEFRLGFFAHEQANCSTEARLILAHLAS